MGSWPQILEPQGNDLHVSFGKASLLETVSAQYVHVKGNRIMLIFIVQSGFHSLIYSNLNQIFGINETIYWTNKCFALKNIRMSRTIFQHAESTFILWICLFIFSKHVFFQCSSPEQHQLNVQMQAQKCIIQPFRPCLKWIFFMINALLSN